ncbi:MAG: hypothetical protein JST54_13190 [Deltaproteobacteria bacterium]|nr:hypothetical protein [Deltaproteobacteria bacterium]
MSAVSTSSSAGSTSGTSASTTGAGTASSTGSSTTTTGTGSSTTTTGSSGSSGGTTGSTLLAEIFLGGWASGPLATAIGYDTALTPSCISMTGGCCYGLISTTDTGLPMPQLSMGTVQINTPSSASTISFAPGGYPVAQLTWAPGDLISFSASGGSIHAFSGQLQAAPPLTAVTPDFTHNAVAVNRTAGLTLTWSPGNGPGETVQFDIQQQGSAPPGQEYILSCNVPDSPGTFTIPPEALQLLETGGASIDASRDVTFYANCDNAQAFGLEQTDLLTGNLTLQ